MLIQIKHLLPNPFRHIETYPIIRAKVETLKTSFSKTGAWPNMMARPSKEHPGKFEIPFAHHRKIALEEFYGPTHKLEITVREISDADMIIMMASENMEEWGTSALVEIETVHAVVQAYAEGKIKLQVEQNSQNRFAPSFIPPGSHRVADTTKPYNAQSIGDFLGWVSIGTKIVQTKVKTALTALQYIEEGLITLDAFKDLGTKGIEAVIIQARQARETQERIARIKATDAAKARREIEEQKKAEARAREEAAAYRRRREEEAACEADERERKAAQARAHAAALAVQKEREEREYRARGREAATKVTKAAVRAIVDEKKGTAGAKEAAIRAFPRHERQAPPGIAAYLMEVKKDIFKLFNADLKDPIATKLNTILEYKDGINEDDLEDTVKTLQSLIWRVEQYAKRFAQETPTMKQAKSAQRALTNGSK